MAAASGTVLIVTAKFDPHADAVIGALRQRAVPVFRLNTDDFHADIAVAADGDGIALSDRWGRTVRLPSGLRSAWYRKPVDPAPPEGAADPGTHALILGETRELLDSLWDDRRLRWVNNPHDNARARRKLPQLRLAAELGLAVPRSLVTNDPARALAFRETIGADLVCKALREVGYADGQDWRSLFTRRVAGPAFAAEAASIAHCPTLLQEYIEKDHELRVTVIGPQVFCCRIDSQAVAAARTDWRRADPGQVPHRIVPLDPGVERALRAMLAAYGLGFGAFDLIVTPSGRHVFLELNPNGQWLWVQHATGADLAGAMADLLAA